MSDVKQSTENLFRFLKEFNKLKIKPRLDISSFEKVLWFYEIPKEKECRSIIHKMDSEKFNKDSENFDKWIEIKKPKRKSCPIPPEEIKPWLKDDTLSGYTKQPQLFNYIIANRSKEINETINEEEKGTDKIWLEDHSEIKQIFENYLNQKWIPWSQEEKRLEIISRIYNNLYEIYKKNKDLGETYQIELGLGFLSSKNEKGYDIKRHIVTTPVSIDFHSITGTMTVGPCEQGAELSLEMDMLGESEKPRNCDEINSRLSDLSNDFWVEENFYDNLKSWLNSYDSNGQFIKNFEKPEDGPFKTLNISPAIILRKRNERVFLKFYDSVVEDIKEQGKVNRPCLQNLIDGTVNHSLIEKNSPGNGVLHEKHYFPLPTNEEQEKIIEKVESNNQVVVQGPPGTGKTHSIANLICHFLANEQKILVTSQTDRALRVLKNKLPKDIKPLCVEILGKDQNSFQELKGSFEVINSEYQNLDKDRLLKNIDKLEKKDNELKGKLATVNTRLIEIKNSETKKFEKLFSFYTGTPAIISARLKNEEEKYKWIKEDFNLGKNDKECPISNDEALSLLTLVKNLKDIDDAVFEEPVEFINQIFTIQKFKEKIKEKKTAEKLIEQYKDSEKMEKVGNYENLKKEDSIKLQQSMASLCPKTETLLNRNEKWVKQALNDCLANRDREWRYLYAETNQILNENESVFKEAEKIHNIKIDPSIPITDLYLTNLLQDFFEKYKPNDKIYWRFFCSKIVRNLKKIKIDGDQISSYEAVKKFQHYVIAKRALEKINNLWTDQGIDTTKTRNRNFKKNLYIFKDLCELLDKCLSAHKLLECVKEILSRNNISQPQWTFDSIKRESNTVEFAVARKKLKTVLADFNEIISFLIPYKNQKNQIAEKVISSIKNRDPEEYKKSLDEINAFTVRKQYFTELCQIRERLQNDIFCLKLKKEADNHQWDERLRYFERAWAWQRADLWLKEQTNEKSYQQLNQEKKDLLGKKKKNMERLVSKKVWFFCLSQITNEELSNLRALIQSITRIGKGMGKSAPRHRKTAKKRMEECKTAVPAWIMPLYRVVENIKPSSEPFDIAIIDEASQTGPDGFLINYLAKKIIVVGDREQIRPENPGIREEDVEILKKKWLNGIKFSDHIGRDYSYYDYCEILIESHVQLREHFRCMPEIIQFSNQISYTGIPLIPLRQYGNSRLLPLKRTFVNNAVSKIGSGRHPQNEKEAQEIANQIKKCIQDPAYKGKTFGIISLQGKTQVKVIEKALLQIDKEEMEKRTIQVGTAYDFQGDERDVIFLSMAVAKDWNISALIRDNHKRRYNVAASRAKDQMWLFHSIEMNDLSNQEDYRRKLLEHFHNNKEKPTVLSSEKLNELYKKIKKIKNKSPDNAPSPFGSWFEVRVFHKIAMKGYQVTPQYKVSGFYIDMIIVGPGGRLAVECDGDYWHEGREEEDLERQWQLERCDWTFWRLRESAFNRNEEEALKSLWNKLDEMKIYPLDSDSSSSSLPESKPLSEKIEPHAVSPSTPEAQKDILIKECIDPRENSIKKISEELFKIVQSEGPIVTKRLYRLYLKSCAVSKLGRQIKKKLNRAVFLLKRKKLIVIEKDILSSGIKDAVFYLPNTPAVVIRKEPTRTIEEVPLNELKKVMDIQTKGNSQSEEEIFRSTLEFYGLSRLTSIATNRLKKARNYKIMNRI